MGPLSVSMTPCMPPELLAPAGTFGLPGPGELQAATQEAATHERRSARADLVSQDFADCSFEIRTERA